MGHFTNSEILSVQRIHAPPGLGDRARFQVSPNTRVLREKPQTPTSQLCAAEDVIPHFWNGMEDHAGAALLQLFDQFVVAPRRSCRRK